MLTFNKKLLLSVFRSKLLLFFLVLLIVIRGCSFRTGTAYPGEYFNRGENAVWLNVTWVNDFHPMEEIETLAGELKRQQIRYVFVFTSYLKPDGEFNETYSHAATFVKMLKSAYPQVAVLAWLGLPLRNSDGYNAGYVELGNSSTRLQIVSFCKKILKETNFDGIHLDPEPVSNNDANILMLLEQLRQIIGRDAILSIATRRIIPIQVIYIEQIAWSADYYREIASRVDQIAIMTYDSGMPTSWLYRQFVRFQTIEVSRAINGTDVQLLIGIPASEEKTRTHNPTGENITSGLQGVIDGLNDIKTESRDVSGVAIYPYWEMDETEWNVYNLLWIRKN